MFYFWRRPRRGGHGPRLDSDLWIADPPYADAINYHKLAESKANQARLRTAGEFGKRMLSGDGFASSLVRQILFAVHQITRTDETANGLN